jgi:hypothetical protein
MQRPFAIWPVLFLLLFLGMGGLYGGIAMLADPSGGLLQLTEVLPLLPVTNFILPGLFLFFVMGLSPLVLIYSLLACPRWRWAVALSAWSKHHWSWTGTVALGLLLAIWLTAQGFLIGFRWPIQYITGITGCSIILLSITPNLRKYYLDEA